MTLEGHIERLYIRINKLGMISERADTVRVNANQVPPNTPPRPQCPPPYPPPAGRTGHPTPYPKYLCRLRLFSLRLQHYLTLQGESSWEFCHKADTVYVRTVSHVKTT